MEFQSNPNDELTTNDITYYDAEHFAALGIPYGQERRTSNASRLLAFPGNLDQALRIFKSRFLQNAARCFAKANTRKFSLSCRAITLLAAPGNKVK